MDHAGQSPKVYRTVHHADIMYILYISLHLTNIIVIMIIIVNISKSINLMQTIIKVYFITFFNMHIMDHAGQSPKVYRTVHHADIMYILYISLHLTNIIVIMIIIINISKSINLMQTIIKVYFITFFNMHIIRYYKKMRLNVVLQCVYVCVYACVYAHVCVQVRCMYAANSKLIQQVKLKLFTKYLNILASFRRFYNI